MRPLVDLLPAALALFGDLLQARNCRLHDLHDDLGGDVRIDAQRGHGQAAQRAAREQVEEAGQLVGLEHALQSRDVGAGYRDVGDEAERHEHAQREQQLAAQVGDLEGVDGGVEERGIHHERLLATFGGGAVDELDTAAGGFDLLTGAG